MVKSKTPSLKKQVEELTDSLKRLQAEYENYRKRTETQAAQHTKYASEDILKQFLPILDNLELAIKHNNQKDDFAKGVELIYASIIDMLHANQVEEIKSEGLPFDPYRHEAMMSKESEQEDNTVIEVLQKGYTIHDRVIRPAKVMISKGGTKK
ncbi:nucleotide exchange factor GrpE [Candidatus Woesearchaeota archaeon]|nr:nucleotide exchange factor GrpE [Candidatus Woesearchaeota archaeon]